MVMIRLRCDPGTEAATISVSLTTSSPTISLSGLQSSSSASTPVIQLQIKIRCTQSINPDKPLTFCTSGTIFETSRPSHGHIDNLSLGLLGPGLVCTNTDGTQKVISMGFFKVHRAAQDGDDATDLLKRPDTSFISVPSRESGEEVVLTHNISAERLFAFAENMTPDNLEVGEEYNIRVSEDHLGTMWWCWGALEGDLKGKKLHSFSKGFCLAGSEEEPSEEKIKREGWVTGEDVAKLLFAFEEGRDRCSIKVVE